MERSRKTATTDMDATGQSSPAKSRRGSRVRLARWLVMWLALYVSGLFAYNLSYPHTRNLLIHRLQAVPAAALINWTDPQAGAVAVGEAIVSHKVTIHLMRGCDGFEAWMILFSALIAFPMAIKKRLIRIGIGSALILALNQARIVSIFHITYMRPDSFELVHGPIWQTIMVLAAVLFVVPSLSPADEAGSLVT